jgi:hypothetical protein
LAEPAPLQFWLLFATWWTQTNWSIASPFEYEVDDISDRFSRISLKHLLFLPLGKPKSFESFSDQIIEDYGMVWPVQDQDTARQLLHRIIELSVINPLVDFGILQTESRPHKILGEEFHELCSIQLTPFGKSILEEIDASTKQQQP